MDPPPDRMWNMPRRTFGVMLAIAAKKYLPFREQTTNQGIHVRYDRSGSIP